MPPPLCPVNSHATLPQIDTNDQSTFISSPTKTLVQLTNTSKQYLSKYNISSSQPYNSHATSYSLLTIPTISTYSASAHTTSTHILSSGSSFIHGPTSPILNFTLIPDPVCHSEYLGPPSSILTGTWSHWSSPSISPNHQRSRDHSIYRTPPTWHKLCRKA